jgi:clan AA aspartic protease
MIRGIVIDHSPYIEVVVIGNRGQIDTVALLDTGFDGDLSLPMEIGVVLGLELRDMVETELADGTVILELTYTAHIEWDGEFRRVSVTLTRSDEALLGTKLLEGKSVNIDFRTGEVIIE